ncbi:DUF2079 domain-containing protein [Vulcanisaeta distributa]|uniref:DUF2079 domain-containing protein n=1 Tax=Vulcanisaeta distributa (strain DSM 14429 / JCM 11212 / NBRC 100878 / IC-017) TaxID=572478 RepID=E1QQ57_VULDI|nr:DUF2079 domain-containing protein [Vulcanisaeta distributa]ADN50429.1 Protein of unknown function DUF2079, membrane [Vulcanisaeta distributa DSM 14429]
MRRSISGLVVYLGIAAYIVVMSYYTLLKYLTFHTHAADLGIFAQALASTLYYHRLFYESVDVAIIPKPGPIGYSFLDVHFSPTLFLFLPVYAVYPSPITLLVAQTILVALGALPIYWLGKYLGRDWLGAFFAIIYLMDPLVQGANSFDFHMETIFMPLALYSTYLLITRKWRIYYPMLLLTLGTIEFAPIPMALLGLYYVIINIRRRRELMHGVLTIAVSIVVLLIALWTKSLLNPLGPTTTSPLSGLPEQYASSFSFGILISVIKDPLLIPKLYSVYGTEKFLYFLELYAPTAFTAFLDPLALPSLAWPLASFLTSDVIYYSPFFQYSSFSVPFIIMASLMAVSKIPIEQQRRLMALILISTLVVFLGVSPIIHFQYQFTKADYDVWSALRLIPSNATVLAQNNLYPPFSNNINAYTQWYPWVKPDYIVAQPDSPWFTWWGTPYNEYVNTALMEGYGVYMVIGNDLLVLRANYTGEPVICAPITINTMPNMVSLINGQVINGEIAHTPSEPPGAWFTMNATLPPGQYEILIKYSWVGPGYLRQLNVTMAYLQINGHVIDLTTGSNESSITIYNEYYGDIVITAYANYVVNTTIYIRQLLINGPICG